MKNGKCDWEHVKVVTNTASEFYYSGEMNEQGV